MLIASKKEEEGDRATESLGYVFVTDRYQHSWDHLQRVVLLSILKNNNNIASS